MGLSIWHLLLVLAIVLVLFGAKRLRNVGGDLGAAIKGFKDAVSEGKAGEQPAADQNATGNVYDAKASQPQQIPQQQAAATPAQPAAPQSAPAQQQPVQQPTQGGGQHG